MKIHNDRLAQRLAKEFGHKKDYDREFTKNIKKVLSQVKEKFGKEISKGTVLHWMSDGPGHRDPDDELLSMVLDVMGYKTVYDFCAPSNTISLNNISAGKADLIKQIAESNFEGEAYKMLFDLVKGYFLAKEKEKEKVSKSDQK